jgi:phenylpyruvate tautomerase PptA (4-oxalocrotonate tautomerase family)
MPHLDIHVSKPVDASVRDVLQKEIGEIMSLIPGKTISNTVISISDGYSMFRDAQPIEAAFVDVRLLKKSPAESKKAFSEKVFGIIETILGVPPSNVQINFVELPDWASGGDYKQ